MTSHINFKILVAGIGNIFRGDDGFGVEVVQRLSQQIFPEYIHIVDFGTRGLDLAYSLWDGEYKAVIIVDAVQKGGQPGSLYLIDPQSIEQPETNFSTFAQVTAYGAEVHDMNPMRILNWLKAMGVKMQWIRVLGCEALNLGSEEEIVVGITGPVDQAVGEAIMIVNSLLRIITEQFLEESGYSIRSYA